MEGLLVIGWLVVAGIVGAVASSRGRSPFGFFLLSAVFSPVLGLIVLLVSKNLAQEAEREVERKRDHELQLEQIRAIAGKPDPALQAVPSGSVSTELERLAALEDKGIITHAEFLEQKRKLLG